MESYGLDNVVSTKNVYVGGTHLLISGVNNQWSTISESLSTKSTGTAINEAASVSYKVKHYEAVEYPQWFTRVLSLTFVAIIIATILNSLALIVFIRNKMAHKPVNETVLNTTVGGLLYGVNTPLHLVAVYYPIVISTSRTVCLLLIATDYFIIILSNLNVVLMTIDRYVAIVHPFVYSKHGNALPRVRWLIVTTWSYSFIAGISHFFYNKWTPTSYCISELTIEFILLRVLVFPVITLGGIAIVALYTRIYFVVAQIHRRVHLEHTQIDADTMNSKKQEYKFTFTILLIVIAYLVCWYPATIMLNLIPRTYYTSAISQLLVVINALFNPIVYIWMIGEFRENFRKIFKCHSSCRIADKSNSNTVLDYKL